jgi:hypothetical protein
MQANPDKFQAIAVGKKTYAKEPVINIESANISCDEVVKLLGIDIDYQLNFNKHIKNICRTFSLFVEMVLLLYIKVLHMCYCNPHR